MNRIRSPFEEIDMIGKLADLKEQHYRQTLALGAVVELLMEKGLITCAELKAKLRLLDGPDSDDSSS